MKFAILFKKRSWSFFLIEVFILAMNVVFTALMPKAFMIWILSQVIPFSLCILISYGMLWYMLADIRGRKTRSAVLQGGLVGFFCGAAYMVLYSIMTLGFGVDIKVSLLIIEVLLLGVAAVGHVLLVIRAVKFFELKDRTRELVAILAAVCIFVGCVGSFSEDFLKTNLRKYSFIADPVVFVNNDGYSVIFATSAPGSAELTIIKDGTEKTYYEEDEGVVLFNSQIHRIDVKKDELDGAEYYVSSRRTVSGSGHYLKMGKRITGDKKKFRGIKTEGDVSFLTLSDNQGTAGATAKAVKNARNDFEYDFVFMLGDHAETYNFYEDDIAVSFLRPAAIASNGEIPVYFTLGNHEYRGTIAPELWKLIPTPSETGEFYYTFTAGNAFFTVLNFGTDHDDDYTAKYDGMMKHNEYRDKEYEWLKEVMAEKPYEGYEYNICISHIPMIFQDDKDDEKIEYVYDHVCTECKKVHDYKCREFDELLRENGISYVVSGHTHKPPRMLEIEGCPYKQLTTGSHVNDHMNFRNTVVYLKNSEMTFAIYEN